MLYKFLAALLAALALIYLGSLSVWVSVLAICVKALAAILAAVLVGGVAVYLWQQYRRARTPRLIFRSK